MGRIEIAKEDYGKPEAVRKAFERARAVDAMLLDRALGILHRMATERTGWRAFFSRWYMMPNDTRLVGDTDPSA